MKRTFATAWLALGCATAFAQTPAITAVLDAGGYTPNIAAGSVFVVKGTNLCSTSVTATAPYSTNPLGPADGSSGSSIQITPVGGGAALSANMVYTYCSGGVTQLAAVMPSAATPGSYNMTVTFKSGAGSNTSAGFQTNVVAHNFQLMTQAGNGSGRALLQNVVSQTQYDLNAFTSGQVPGQSFLRSPAHPGEVLIAWGVGLGAAPGYDASAPAGGLDFSQQLTVQAIVAGVTISPAYAGRSNLFPGLDNIAFQLPTSIATGCAVPLQISVGGQLSNATTISISSGSAATCSSQVSNDILTKLDSGGTYNAGTFTLTSLGTSMSFGGQSISIRNEAASGSFNQYTADTINLIPASPTTIPTGQCQVAVVTSQTGSSGGGGATAKALDAGTITLNGPNVANKAFTEKANAYSLSLGQALNGSGLPPIPGFNSSPLITAGTYSLTGGGGTDVGKFTANITIDQPLTVTGGLPATVVRSQGLPLAWTGGGTDLVIITGVSSVATSGTLSNGTVTSGTFTCITTADKLSFTVPSSILQQLPATPAGASSTTAGGILSIFANSQPSTGNGLFTAPLVPTGNTDSGLFLAGIGDFGTATYQ
jgi:uncharacterized protein (TIGR03437 family)